MTAANSKQHRKSLIQTTIRLLRRQGYAATGLNEILKISKAPKGSLYYYFPGGKEELAAISVTAASKTVLETLEKLEDTTASAPEFISRYCTLLMGWMELSNYAEGCPISTTLLEMVPQSDLIARAGRDGFTSWKSVFIRVFSRDGLKAQEAQEKATFLMAAIQGALLLSRVEQSSAPLKGVGNQKALF
ncbi:MAG: TetR/AcrR family transcriptional regulator [Sneathiella sp.]|nr:TetR/AcrR family transcriptional regulator [Sneathiella sp.]